MRFPKLLIFILVVTTQCYPARTDLRKISFPSSFSYEEMTKVNLTEELEEISGLEWVGMDRLWAVEDESSIIYQLNPTTGKILKKRKFAKNRDIEDLLALDETAWVLESNGTLYRVTDALTKQASTTQYHFPLSGKRDMEAIVSKGSDLLVFCKVCSWDKGPERASVFRFDLNAMAYDSVPLLILDRDEIQPLLQDSAAEKLKIQPSAAAFHPIDHNLYILSSTGKWIMIMDATFKPLEVHRLDPIVFKQPEGITFDPDGNMYISNEAKDGRANILYFPYSPGFEDIPG